MNNWRSRILFALVLTLVMISYSNLTADIPNTPWGMLVFHGGAAFFDFVLLYFVPVFLKGRLAFLVETSCTVSITWNFIGWLAYLAYAPPILYNTLSWGLSYVQWGIILFMDRSYDDPLGFGLVRGAYRKSAQPYFAEANQ